MDTDNQTPDPDSAHETSSDALLRRSWAGDESAVRALLVTHYGRLRAFLRLRLDPEIRARESASDLAQSVCRQVLEREESFEYMGEPAFRAWLFEAALLKIRERRAYHLAQKRDPRREEAGDGAIADWAELADAYRTSLDPVGRALRREEIEHLEKAFDTLTDEMREVLTLRQVCELPYPEIAVRLGKSETSVRQTVSRGRAMLAAQLARSLPDE